MVKSKGFTYIEILLVLAIVSLVTVIGLRAYSTYNIRSSLEKHVREVTSYVDLARSKSSASDVECGTFTGTYSFDVNPTTKMFSVTPTGCTTITTYTLPDGYSVTSPAVSTSMTFKPQNLGADVPMCIEILYANGLCGTINIEQSGATDYDIMNSCGC